MIDPATVCPDHGSGELTVYTSACRGVPITRTYCRACRRARAKARGLVKVNRSQSFCYRGHLKTLRTWRAYNGVHRCLACQYVREQERKEGRYVRDRRPAAA